MEDQNFLDPPSRPERRWVTNVNIFALAPIAAAQPSVALPDPSRDEPSETLVSPQWMERRSRKLDGVEQELRRRSAELDAREAELEQREAEFEAEVFIRSEALEEREQRLAELDQKLGRRENELGSYVARLQSGFLRADAL